MINSKNLSTPLKSSLKWWSCDQWLLSFSDGCSSGDGTIYRASGFKLIGIKENNGLFNYNGEDIHGKVLWDRGISKSWCIQDKELEVINARPNTVIKRISGFQLKYIYLIDKSCKITVPILPFSEIDKQGAGMYKGEKITLAERQIKD